MRRLILLTGVLALPSVSALAAPSDLAAVPCQGWAADIPRVGPGIDDLSCYAFQAVAGELIEASCSAEGVALNGVPYPMSCRVYFGPAGASASEAYGVGSLLQSTQSTGAYTFAVAYDGRQSFFADEKFQFQVVSRPTCVADANSLCLGDWRFRVSATYVAADGSLRNAMPVPLTTDSGYFYFFDASNVELVLKVLDACASDGEWWVFAAGLTDVGVTLTVLDTTTHAQKVYTNPAGQAFAPIQDTAAFPCP